MKSSLLVLLGCFSLLVTSYAFGCGDNWGCQQQSSCASQACESQNDCQCADINAGRNPCISKSRYCELFGNAGDNQFSDDLK